MLDNVLEEKPLAGGNAYYTAVDSEVVMGEVFAKLAHALHEFGVIKSPEVDEFTQDEVAKVITTIAYFAEIVAKKMTGILQWPVLAAFAFNCRMTDSRSRSLGWKPTHTGEFLDGIRDSVEAFVKQDPSFR